MAFYNLFHSYGDQTEETPNKITIVGCGQVGMACCISLMMQKVPSEIVLIDIPQCEKKLHGEEMDLRHGMGFFPGCRVSASSDYATTANSKICIVTAGARQLEGETRINLVGRNAEIMKNIIPQIVKYSPECILLIVSNPVDIMTYLSWKLSGFPKSRVIGSGTCLDSSRFRVMIAEYFKVSPTNIQATIIGEHGDSSVPVWSSTTMFGILLKDVEMSEADRQKVYNIHSDVVNSAYEIIQHKGCTSWGIGVCVTAICDAIISYLRTVFPVSIQFNVTNLIICYPEIKSEAFISMPCVIGAGGILNVIKLKLNDIEFAKLKASVNLMNQVIESIN